jgi:hypothetical protein
MGRRQMTPGFVLQFVLYTLREYLSVELNLLLDLKMLQFLYELLRGVSGHVLSGYRQCT